MANPKKKRWTVSGKSIILDGHNWPPVIRDVSCDDATLATVADAMNCYASFCAISNYLQAIENKTSEEIAAGVKRVLRVLRESDLLR